jgi:hypothetical protein
MPRAVALGPVRRGHARILLRFPCPSSLRRTRIDSSTMVEWHAGQRLQAAHRQSLPHRAFHAATSKEVSKEGISAIDGRTLVRVEAFGKNLLHFYSDDRKPVAKAGPADIVVMHCHFVKLTDGAPGAKQTTRRRLSNSSVVKALVEVV